MGGWDDRMNSFLTIESVVEVAYCISSVEQWIPGV